MGQCFLKLRIFPFGHRERPATPQHHLRGSELQHSLAVHQDAPAGRKEYKGRNVGKPLLHLGNPGPDFQLPAVCKAEELLMVVAHHRFQGGKIHHRQVIGRFKNHLPVPVPLQKDKSPLQRGTGAVLCMADKLSAFDRENLIVPIWMI